MDNHEEDDEPKWIKKVKEGGAVPHLEPDNCSNGWATPPGNIFSVRGPNYFSDKVKIPAGEYLLKPLGFDWIKGPSKISELLSEPKNRVHKALEDEFPIENKPFIWAFNLQVPSKENYSAIAYFVSLEPIPEGSLMDRFVKGDDVFKNSRLKMIANIVEGPWVVKKAVGEQAICVIGRALNCRYIVGDNFVEVDIDISSSVIANAIVNVAIGYITTLTVDLAFLIEGQDQSELPERILGAIRFSELELCSARPVELSSDTGECEMTKKGSGDLQMSLPTRLWMSIGQGFTHLLTPNAQESVSSQDNDDDVDGDQCGQKKER